MDGLSHPSNDPFFTWPEIRSGSHCGQREAQHRRNRGSGYVFYCTSLLLSNRGPSCCYRAKYLYDDGPVLLCEGKWNLIISVFHSNGKIWTGHLTLCIRILSQIFAYSVVRRIVHTLS